MSVLEEVEALKKEATLSNEEQPASKEPEQIAIPVVTAEETTTMVQDRLKEAMQDKVKDSAKDIKEMARDLTYLKGASDLQGNEEFKKDYQEELAKQLVKDLEDEGKRAAIQQAAKKQEARNIRNEAFFQGCKPVFAMLNITEAYGLVPMILTIVVLMVPFLLVSFLRFGINAVNSLFVAISGFAKPAFWICTIIVVAVITIAAVIGVLYLVDAVFGTTIMQLGSEVAKGIVTKR